MGQGQKGKIKLAVRKEGRWNSKNLRRTVAWLAMREAPMRQCAKHQCANALIHFPTLRLRIYFMLAPVFSRSSFFVIVPFRSVLKNRNDSNRSVPFRSFRSYHGTGRNGTERNDGTEKPAVPN